MQIKIKTTGFKLTEGLRLMAEGKLLSPVEKRVGSELPADHFLEIELAKITEHHEEGRIWKCEVNLVLPRVKRTLYAKAIAESLETAIDEAKDEILREISDYKNKRASRFLRVARKLKDYAHITRLARGAGNLYRWIRKDVIFKVRVRKEELKLKQKVKRVASKPRGSLEGRALQEFYKRLSYEVQMAANYRGLKSVKSRKKR